MREGIADTALRIGHRSTGIWAPEILERGRITLIVLGVILLLGV